MSKGQTKHDLKSVEHQMYKLFYDGGVYEPVFTQTIKYLQ